MADVIRKATNKFSKGLVMDFSPENTQNEVLTHALNATLLTFNGNEMSLQNDMGNGRVETAFLPEGYIPVGTCEYGGIIYIVSYNPLEDKSQIGCFPSPERNISSDELGIAEFSITKESFQNTISNSINTRGSQDSNSNDFNSDSQLDNKIPDGTIINTSKYVLLKNDNLNPGDKFIVSSDENIYTEQLADLLVETEDGFKPKEHPILKLSIVSIEDNGKIIYLNSTVKKYEKNGYKYHILGQNLSDDEFIQNGIDIDAYRNTLSSGYSVFKSKTSGKLAILAELIMIDSYSVTHELVKRENEDNIYDIVIYSDISPEIKEDTYNIVPKLKYYFLKNSQGILQKNDTKNINLFKVDDEGNPTKEINYDFLNTKLSEIYEYTDSYNPSLNEIGSFNFPRINSYCGRPELYIEDLENPNKEIFTKFTEGKYHRIKKNQIINNSDYYVNELNAKFYYYNPNDIQYKEVETNDSINNQYTYYTLELIYVYHDAERNTDIKETLYELISIPSYASDVIINNKNIEKYQYVNIYRYRSATREEVEKNSKTFYVYDPERNEYTSITGTPNPALWNTYYVKEEKRTLKSVGKDINKDDYKEDLYYFPGNKEYIKASQETIDEYYNFILYPNECPITLYYRTEEYEYKLASEELLNNYSPNSGIKLYYDSNYIRIFDINAQIDSNLQWFIVVPMDQFISFDKFKPNSEYNKIIGYDNPEGEYPKDDYLEIYSIADYIPNNVINQNNYLTYDPIKLGNIKIPSKLAYSTSIFPFKYDYTLVPCMNYGRLDHLSVSNSIDFSKLWSFEASNFNIWKYRIDGNQLRLTFGTEIYDTHENDKIDAIVLEFYDHVGFAGSIEIIGKKSYSGIFTKIIQLNSLNAISKKRIINNKYVDTYKRNVNIIKSGDTYKLNNQTVKYVGIEKGWEITTDSVLQDPDQGSDQMRSVGATISLGIQDNDCGTLYSNLIYGVKTYLRRTKNKGTNFESYEFIPKKELFLFTLPIYNDRYYKDKNFDDLENPKLKLALTYKLKDEGTKEVYNHGIIKDGYFDDSDDSDYKNASNYMSGFSDQNNLELIKYYKYSGPTKLWLDVGLHKDYNQFNLTYDHNINQFFKCNLKLLSNDESSFQTNFNKEEYLNEEQFLNYKDSSIKDNNYLQFNNGKSTISIAKLSDHNYLNSDETDPIEIDYNFITGYKIFIEDIVSSEIQTNTVCALCHKKDNDEYNYEDFGIFNNSSDDSELLYNNNIIYTGGNKTKFKAGIATLKTHTISNFMVDFSSNPYFGFKTISENNISESTSNQFNYSILKQIGENIGKLSFCPLHYHYIEPNNYCPSLRGILLEDGSNNEWSEYATLPIHDVNFGNEDGEITDGIAGSIKQWCQPIFNTWLVTNNFINGSEYHSMWYYDGTDKQVKMLQVKKNKDGDEVEAYDDKITENYKTFTGLVLSQIPNFNKCLMNSMKTIYAYNPDYNTRIVQKGKVSVQDYNPSFTSNIICELSKLEFKPNESLNNYIAFGGILISEYLNDLSERSGNSEEQSGIKIKDENDKFLSKIQFEGDFTYCGTPNQPCLITSLTYNTPVPKEIVDELEFNNSNETIVVRHEDKTFDYLYGPINKNTLYGFYDFTKTGNDQTVKFKKILVELDVGNYKINDVGNLQIITSYYPQDYPIKHLSNKINNYFEFNGYQYNIKNDYKNKCFKYTTITVNDLIYNSNSDHRLCVKNNKPQKANRYIYYRHRVDFGDYGELLPKDIDGINDIHASNPELNRINLSIGPCLTNKKDL